MKSQLHSADSALVSLERDLGVSPAHLPDLAGPSIFGKVFKGPDPKPIKKPKKGK